MNCCLKSRGGRFLFEERRARQCQRDPPRPDFFFSKRMTFKRCETKKKKKTLLKTPHYSVTYPRSEPGFVSHALSLSAQKSGSTLLGRRRGANGSSIRLADPTPLLHLLSPPPAPSWLRPSTLRLSHLSPLLCTFFFVSVPSRSHNLPLCPLLVTVSIFSDLLSPRSPRPPPPARAHASWWMSNLVALYSTILVRVR